MRYTERMNHIIEAFLTTGVFLSREMVIEIAQVMDKDCDISGILVADIDFSNGENFFFDPRDN